MNSKIEDLLNAAKVNELLHKKELEEKNKNTIMITLAMTIMLTALMMISSNFQTTSLRLKTN